MTYAPLTGQAEPLALYIHWPFCVSKCPYCDFNSHVRDQVDQSAWRDALLADMAHEAAITGKRPLTSIFFGGGTPSLMPPATVAALLSAAEAHWGFADDIEISLEANPSSVEAACFSDLASTGVNRVSLGIQALDEMALRFLGRAHGVGEALTALAVAQKSFARVSFDLIYALPGQDEATWAATLRRALSLGTRHLSLYQLTIEPGTRFATLVAREALKPADAETSARLFEVTDELTTAAGLPAYEVSNHAAPGEESRHNLAYWRYQDYLGIGPGAHGRRGKMASFRHRKPETFLTAVDRNGHGLKEENPLSPAERAREALLMGLRLHDGVDIGAIAARTGHPVAALIDARRTERLAGHGLIARRGDQLCVTRSGMLLLDAILADIVTV